MRQKIDCFLTCEDTNVINDEINKLRNSRTIQNIYLLMAGDNINNDNDEASEGRQAYELGYNKKDSCARNSQILTHTDQGH